MAYLLVGMVYSVYRYAITTVVNRDRIVPMPSDPHLPSVAHLYFMPFQQYLKSVF